MGISLDGVGNNGGGIMINKWYLGQRMYVRARMNHRVYLVATGPRWRQPMDMLEQDMEALT